MTTGRLRGASSDITKQSWQCSVVSWRSGDGAAPASPGPGTTILPPARRARRGTRGGRPSAETSRPAPRGRWRRGRPQRGWSRPPQAGGRWWWPAGRRWPPLLRDQVRWPVLRCAGCPISAPFVARSRHHPLLSGALRGASAPIRRLEGRLGLATTTIRRGTDRKGPVFEGRRKSSKNFGSWLFVWVPTDVVAGLRGGIRDEAEAAGDLFWVNTCAIDA